MGRKISKSKASHPSIIWRQSILSEYSPARMIHRYLKTMRDVDAADIVETHARHMAHASFATDHELSYLSLLHTYAAIEYRRVRIYCRSAAT